MSTVIILSFINFFFIENIGIKLGLNLYYYYYKNSQEQNFKFSLDGNKNGGERDNMSFEQFRSTIMSTYATAKPWINIKAAAKIAAAFL